MTPNLNNLRAGNSDCPSDFALDRLHAGGCENEEASKLDSHVASCKVCEARMTERRAGFAAVPTAYPVKMLAAIRRGVDEPSRVTAGQKFLSWTRRFLAPLLVVAAAGVILYPRPPKVDGPGYAKPEVRAKGGLALHVFHQVGQAGEEVSNGATVNLDDRLRFAVDLPETGAIGILGLEDKRGEIFKVWPLDNTVSTELNAGTNIELPGAVQLDGLGHGESFFLVECPSTAQIAQCRSRNSRLTCPKGCESTSFALEKKKPESAEP
jgi:hypothetical protein